MERDEQEFLLGLWMTEHGQAAYELYMLAGRRHKIDRDDKVPAQLDAAIATHAKDIADNFKMKFGFELFGTTHIKNRPNVESLVLNYDRQPEVMRRLMRDYVKHFSDEHLTGLLELAVLGLRLKALQVAAPIESSDPVEGA